MITAEEVRALLDYDADSGILTWKYRPRLVDKAKAWNRRYSGTAITSLNGHGYVQLSIHKRKFEAHRIVWLWIHGKLPDGNIDHINGDKTDNRISNLREASVSQNAWNMRKKKESGLRGASIHTQTGRWQSHLCLNGEHVFLGLFGSEAEAHEAYKRASIKYHGEYSPYGAQSVP